MKKLARAIVVSILGWQVRRLRKKHAIKIVGVVGSIGKTSTKFAIAQVLAQKYRVRFQAGNYNDLVTVPLVFFDLPEPSLMNPFAWLLTFIKIEARLLRPYEIDVVIAEISTDGPGQIAQFQKYLHCDVSVVTAITPEHMEFFRDLDHVAEEEFAAANYSSELIVNMDFCDEKYLVANGTITTYGSTKETDYRITNERFEQASASFEVHRTGEIWLEAHMDAVAKSELYSAAAAAVVADKVGLTGKQIVSGIVGITPVSGRMQRLQGIKDSLILDETYNASPEAVRAALDSLYSMKAPQKIAILGNMNELGDYAKAAHIEIGQYCDASQLDLVVTIGPEANEYLAPAAVEKGCMVKVFDDPYAAGEFVQSFVKSGAIILAKGSQNKVYAEEAVKPLLKNPSDISRLVRQSPSWLKKKRKNFA